ncbi:efflux RND transporter permease subunit [Gynurincola endophyticus]|jgi:HAE1 family hydrophobic/amphiphilic exporter-1|uniref:efflux RND transporter permease subunit n=1 Tax=Gynurincola endophyticus TaxID=2479004 RepID=UPI000F8D99DE|nr:efflux RND transporter permease subunit [Gynurincola endophyticus]
MLKKIIERPVLATVISILLVLLGIVGIIRIPMTQFPEIAPPTVYVYGVYPGGNSESVLRGVITPLEEAINGVEDMQYMTSNSSNDGSFSITIIFKQNVDPDQAAVNVQNRVAQANSQLPQEVLRLGVNTTKQQTSNIAILSIKSTKPEQFDEAFLQNYANINLVPQLKRIPGVGNINLFGEKNYSIRVWLDPVKLANNNILPSDVENAIYNNSFESSPGRFGEESDAPLQYVLKYKGKLNNPEAFERIVIKSSPNGSILRLTDVARIEFGVSTYATDTEADGLPAIAFSVVQASGSNANEIAVEVMKVMEQFQADAPDGVEYFVLQNVKEKMDASINQMKSTLIEAFILVFIVVFIFLQDFRSTIIPAIAVPVSIIGTFFFMYLIGFTVNVLTLFALVLAIGIVVDDAIVVVEAVHAKMSATRDQALKATVSTMGEISSAIVSITLVMSAVFLPVGFMEGPAGIFYKQFSYTLAIAILISAVNALTLSPALCALLLKNHEADEHSTKKGFGARFASAFNTSFDRFTGKYIKVLSVLGKRIWLTMGGLVAVSLAAFFLMQNSQKGFIPAEDDSFLTYVVTMQVGTNIQYTQAEMDTIRNVIQSIPEVESINVITGFNIFSYSTSPNTGLAFIKLKKPSERTQVKDIDELLMMVQEEVTKKTKAEFLIFRAPAVEGFGTVGGVEFVIQDRTGGSVEQLGEITYNVINELNQQPELAGVFTMFRSDYPQYEVIIDEDKAELLGTNPREIMTAMQLYLGGSQTTDFIRFGKLYRVNLKADADYRKDESTLDNIMIRNNKNQMIPISTLVTLKKVYGPEVINRFNLFNSITVNANAAAGISTGKAMEIIDKVLAEHLPKGYGYEYAGLSREERSAGMQMVFIFGLSIIFVYFLLAAQYESYLLPLAVMLSLPTGILGVYIATGVMGIDNNIYVQISLVMLVGLLAKNAILIVEFAIQQRKLGKTIFDAAMSAAKLRLRPILMTSFAFIAGLIPLMLSKGETAMGNRSISISAAGGMLSGVIIGLFIIPVLFIVFQTLQEKVSTKKIQHEVH